VSATFDLQPTLTGSLLLLRPLRPEDAEALYAVASDPLMWEQHPDSDRYQRTVFDRLFAESLASGGALAVIERASGTIVGSSRFNAYEPAASRIEIGWSYLARAYWGGTYNAELKRLMLGHAFAFVKEVVFAIGSRNLRSQRAIEKLGAVRTGSRSDAAGRESYVYSIRANGQET
jgi:RimJ/RimL family protein N-acetyltransferase